MYLYVYLLLHVHVVIKLSPNHGRSTQIYVLTIFSVLRLSLLFDLSQAIGRESLLVGTQRYKYVVNRWKFSNV